MENLKEIRKLIYEAQEKGTSTAKLKLREKQLEKIALYGLRLNHWGFYEIPKR